MRARLRPAALVVVAAAAACGEPTSSGPTDAAVAPTDAGAADPAQASPPDSGPDPARTFVEELLDTARIDLLDSTALIDTSPPGRAWAAPFGGFDSDRGAGEGGDSTGEELGPGEHNLAQARLSGPLLLDGPLVLRVQGELSLAPGASLDVRGALVITADTVTLGAGSTIRGASLRVSAAGKVTIEPGASIEVDEALILETQGALGVEGASLRAGRAVARAYGPVTLAAGASLHTSSGGVVVASESAIELGEAVVVEAPEILASVTLQSGGDLRMGRGSRIDAGQVARLDLVARGSAHLDGAALGSSRGGATDLGITAGSITIEDSTIRPAYPGGGTRGGNVSLRSAGELEIRTSTIHAGIGGCMRGGAVTLEAEGDLTLEGTCARGGDFERDLLKPVCTQGPAGDASIRTGGALIVIDAPPDCPAGARGGAGSPEGRLELRERDPPGLAVVDPGLRGEALLVSLPLPMELTIPVREATARIDVPPGELGEVSIAPDGSAGGFVPASELAGVTLRPGWRFRARLTARLLDAAILDRVTIRW